MLYNIQISRLATSLVEIRQIVSLGRGGGGAKKYRTAELIRLSDTVNFLIKRLCSGDDSFAGASFCARTALDASVGIDFVDVAFRDSVNGANGLASATSHA